MKMRPTKRAPDGASAPRFAVQSANFRDIILASLAHPAPPVTQTVGRFAPDKQRNLEL